jgi:hypothetical protein
MSQEVKWVFKFANRKTGEIEYTQPSDLKTLMEAVKSLKVEGQFCICVLIPDFKAEVDISLDVKGSNFLQGEIPEINLEKVREDVRSSSEVPVRRKRRPAKVAEESVGAVRDEAVRES